MSRLGSALTHTKKTLRPRKGACGCSVGCVNRGTRYGCRCFHRRVQRRKAPTSAEATYLRDAQQDQRSACWHALRRRCASLGQRSLGASNCSVFQCHKWWTVGCVRRIRSRRPCSLKGVSWRQGEPRWRDTRAGNPNLHQAASHLSSIERHTCCAN